MKYFLLSILLITAAILNSYPQDMPQIPEQIKAFYGFEGTWEGEASMTMGTEVSKGTITHVWSKIADGWGMLVDETLDVPAMGKKYIGHNIFGFDIGEGMYHLYTIDNFADCHDHKGKMTDNNIINLEHNGLTTSGKQYKEKLTLKIVSPTELVIEGEASIDGKIQYTFNTNMKKTK